jgi:hypothetical protein
MFVHTMTKTGTHSSITSSPSPMGPPGLRDGVPSMEGKLGTALCSESCVFYELKGISFLTPAQSLGLAEQSISWCVQYRME